MASLFTAALVVLLMSLIAAPAFSSRGEDFVFDNSEEIQIDTKGKSNELQTNTVGLKKLWGVPDTTAYVGHLFRMEIPNEAFSKSVVSYKIKSVTKRRAPDWLAVDSRHGLLRGVPTEHDVGSHTLSVQAFGRNPGETAIDTFSIEVKGAIERPQHHFCAMGESRMVLMILIGESYRKLLPKQRSRAIMELAKFMALPEDTFFMDAYKMKSANEEIKMMMSGAGESKNKNINGATAIYLNVGCGSRMWEKQKLLVHQIGTQARDGTLANVLQLPTIGWRLLSVKNKPRPRRQLPEESSAYYDETLDYSGYGDDDDDGDIDDEDYNQPSVISPHAHRHHHGEHRDRPDINQPTLVLTTPQPPYSPNIPRYTPSFSPFTPRYTSLIPQLTQRTPAHTQSFYVPQTLPGTFYFGSTTSKMQPSTQRTPFTHPDSIAHTSLHHHRVSHPPRESTPTLSSTPHIISESSLRVIPVSSTRPSTVSPTRPILVSQPVAPSPSPSPTFWELTSKQPITHASSTERPAPKTTSVLRTSSMQVSTNEAVTESATTVTDYKRVEVGKKRVHTAENDSLEEVSREFAPTNNMPTEKQSTPASSTTSTTSQPPIVIVPSSELPPQVSATTVQSVTLTPAVTETIDDLVTSSSRSFDTIATDARLYEVTKQEPTASVTDKTSTISGQTTETIEFTAIVPNQPPLLNHHMKKLAVTAGKAFRYIIPVDLFSDLEDGTNLKYSLIEADGKSLSPDSWIQFIPEHLEVYGLPLNDHASKWNYIVEVSDSKGATARAPLDVTVQQHKGLRTVTHEFLLNLELLDDYPIDVNWQIKTLESLVNLFHDRDMEHLTVRNVSRSGRFATFTWTNDSLPKDCDNESVNRLKTILESNNIAKIFAPSLKVTNVSVMSVGVCATSAPPPLLPVDTPKVPSHDNYAPVLRNQIDHLKVIAGQLLVYTVPEDTFFDPEEGNTRELSLRVVSGDRTPLPTLHWLQFDANNQEFYGLPSERDVGRMQYQLIAEDTGGKTANDVLIVEVTTPPTQRHNVEFSITLDIPYERIASSAALKKAFVERLCTLFGDKSADSVRVKSIKSNPTTVSWYNTSLPSDRCPVREIEQFDKVVSEAHQGVQTLSNALLDTFGVEFNVMSVQHVPMNLCLSNKKGSSDASSGNFRPIPEPNAEKDDYLLTFIIPVAAVVVMLIVAALVAILLRRRRARKLNLSDEMERTAFRTRGIPVIFQDELEERIERGQTAAAPLIVASEKPPLAPSPRAYRAPPPLVPPATARLPPAPHYRKPPPYVPP